MKAYLDLLHESPLHEGQCSCNIAQLKVKHADGLRQLNTLGALNQGVVNEHALDNALRHLVTR